jgi:acyl-coenzyme A synthetase/AMP-(fatty) acid ligase
MTPRTTKIRDVAVSALITGVATLFLSSAVRSWDAAHTWETVTDHKADIQAVSAKLDRVLDALCQLKADLRACGAAGEVRLP